MTKRLRDKKRLNSRDEALIIDTMGAWLIEHGEFPTGPVDRDKVIAQIMERVYKRDERRS
jgi:hypothetical protein